MKTKANKGVTLISLVITIIVLLILAGIGITSGVQTIKSSKQTKFTTEMKIMQVEANELYDAYKNNKGVKKSYFIGFISTLLYACTDEIHQLFIEGRSGEIRDILVDSTGALIGMVLVSIILKIKKRV